MRPDACQWRATRDTFVNCARSFRKSCVEKLRCVCAYTREAVGFEVVNGLDTLFLRRVVRYFQFLIFL